MLGSALLGSFYLASATAQTPGLPPPIPPGRKALLWARSNIARSNATRSNYIRPNVTVLLEKFRYPDPPSTVDVTAWARNNTVTVRQALNDEPDTCSLTFKPELPPEHIPQVGDVVAVGLATEGMPDTNSAYPAAVKADGAVAYWRLGEASGTTASDSIGTAHGTISGGVTLNQAGAVTGNAAMTFDGTTGKIQTATTILIPVTATIEVWVMATAADQRIAVSQQVAGEFAVGVLNQKLYIYAGGAGIASSNRSINDGVWHHSVCVIDGANLSMYLDGVLDKTVAWARAASSTGTIGIGWDASNWFLGRLDDVAIYPTALTPAQIANHYALRNQNDIRIAGGLEFTGSIVIKQHDRRPRNASPWIAVQCQDWSWFFDAQLVNARWPTQSATLTALDLVARFVNYSQLTPAPIPFGTAFIAKDLPTCEAFEAVNWRPSDVLRHLANAIKGGFYIDARREVRLWTDGPEPQTSGPRPLTDYLTTLKTFRHSVDASQVRRRVVVEGMRTSTSVDVPALPQATYDGGIPVADARPFVTGAAQAARLGSQWVTQQITHTLQAANENPFTAHVLADKDLTEGWMSVDALPSWLNAAQSFTTYGWIKVGEQFVRYSAAYPNGAGRYDLYVNAAGWPFGKMIAPIKIGETVTWVDWIDVWSGDAHNGGTVAGGGWVFEPLRARAAGAELVLRVDAFDTDAAEPWAQHVPAIEALIIDGRYGYGGALERAQQDLLFFKAPRLTAEWETTDYNARPGRSQIIQLTETDPVNAVLTILAVDLTFQLRHLAPRRRCTAALVKPSTFLDVVTTTQA